MSKITFTADDILRGLNEAVQGKPDGYTYSDQYEVCAYTTDGGAEPRCIAGDALYRLGVPLEVLNDLDDKNEHGVIWDSNPIDSPDVVRVLKNQGFEFEPEALTALRIAQKRQDRGIPHSEALADALAYIENREQ